MKPPVIDYALAVEGLDIDEDRAPLAERLLGIVSSLVRAEARQEWVDDAGLPTEVPEIAQTVALQCFARAMAVPTGEVSTSVLGYQATWDRDSARGAYLTTEDKRLLRSLRPRSARGGLSILSTRTDAATDASLGAYSFVGPDGEPMGSVDLDGSGWGGPSW